MSIQIILLILAIGIAAGMLGGLVGIGGGIIIVPALVYLLGMSQFSAQGTSLAMILFPVGILGVLEYYKQGFVNWPVVFVLAIGFVAGSFLGSRITLGLPQETIKRFFAILLLVLSVKMLFFDTKKIGAQKQNPTTSFSQQENTAK